MVTEKAPLIAPEQGLLLHLYLFGAGIVLFHLLPAAWQDGDRLLGVVLGGAAVTLCCRGAMHYFDQRPVLGAVLLVLASGVGGVTVAGHLASGWSGSLYRSLYRHTYWLACGARRVFCRIARGWPAG